jgi:hypothetical protein
MKKLLGLLGTAALAGSFVLAGASADPTEPAIFGDYVEVRTADVWTGPCFANGEVDLTGKEALLAWHVKEGSWQGVTLDDLKVVAVVRANATLGDPFSDPLPARSVILVDERASSEQSAALEDFAREMGGELLQEVVWVKAAPIRMEVLREHGKAEIRAGDVAELRTRALNHHDTHCGNEFLYYPPLTEVENAAPVFALAHRFNGDGLGSTWSSPFKRSAFIGTFER